MRVRLLLLAALLGAGCTSMPSADGSRWSKLGGSMSQATLDEATCASETRNAGRGGETGVGGLSDLVRWNIENGRRPAAFDACMLARGYQSNR